MASKLAGNPKKLLDKVIKLLTRERTDLDSFYQTQMQYVDKKTATPTIGGFVFLSDICGFLSSYHGILGLAAILRGDAGGWKEVHRSVTYQRWTVTMCRVPYEKPVTFANYGGNKFLRKNERYAASLACYGVACGLDDIRDEGLRTLTGIPGWPDSVDPKHWNIRIFEPFVVVLLKRMRGEAVPEEFAMRNLGVYSQVLDAWDDFPRLEKALGSICDYHCQQMDGDIFKWYPEFERPPFKLVPIEILAIRRIREQLGLPMPEIQHPLLELPTANMPLPTPEDTQPDEVINRIRRAYPELLEGE